MKTDSFVQLKLNKILAMCRCLILFDFQNDLSSQMSVCNPLVRIARDVEIEYAVDDWCDFIAFHLLSEIFNSLWCRHEVRPLRQSSVFGN